MTKTRNDLIYTERKVGVNEFALNIGTVNGSGSQTANLTILRAIFRMGVPVSGKNIFPSNIQGLPTWYKIRVSEKGYLARPKQADIVIAMNPKTFVADHEDLCPNGLFLYDGQIREELQREDMTAVSMPIREILKEAKPHRDLKNFVANMVYVGVLAELLGIELDPIRAALSYHFKGIESPIEFNMKVIEMAHNWAEENLELDLPYSVEARNLTDGYMLTNGNVAGGLGTIYGGVHFVSWYPITPATSLPEAILEYAPQLRTNHETGEQNFAIVQAEDELAAVGMVAGAGWAGLRAMTATSGPGLSLMGEYTSLAYLAELPIVIWVIQRVGPSTGLPTRTAQGDVNLTYYLGQGDTEHIVLIPGNMSECFEYGWKALDLAEEYQTAVFVLSDLDLGQNQWMTPHFEYPDTPIQRGKILWEEEFEKVKESWGRYRDLDGDHIPYRTVPGNTHSEAAYYARGTGHDDDAQYSENPENWERNLNRLKDKIDSSREILPKPVIKTCPGGSKGIIAFGSTDAAVQETRDQLEADDLCLDYLRLRALPVSEEVKEFIRKREKTYVIENNRDGQMHAILSLEVPEAADRLVSIAHVDGLPLCAGWITRAILEKESE